MCSRALAVRCPTPAISCPKCCSGAAFRGTFEGHPPHEVIGWVTRINCFLLFDLLISTRILNMSQASGWSQYFVVFQGETCETTSNALNGFGSKRWERVFVYAVLSTVPWVSVLDVLNGKDGLLGPARLKMQGYQARLKMDMRPYEAPREITGRWQVYQILSNAAWQFPWP